MVLFWLIFVDNATYKFNIKCLLIIVFVILDEVILVLDNELEAIVQKAMGLFAHSLSTIKNTAKTSVTNEREIVE